MITISLETLPGKLRATGRIDGRTVEYFEGADASLLVFRALNAAASQHRLPTGGYDMTHIRLNDLAAKAIYHQESPVR